MVCIRCDAKVAGNFASGYWDTGLKSIGEFAREAARFLLECCIGVSNVCWQHAPAHCGQPWNEMADKVAELRMLREPADIPWPNPG